ncbi:DNA translocase FtsK [Lachnospiraceae bacterium OttesenSCG-928-J05]|nr:DNA translocase FtsK [Lachnospiraceae bacterium OttesenSCG-928-J05]
MATKKAKPTRKKSVKKKETGKETYLYGEIIIWATLAVAVLLMLGVFGVGGFAGDMVKNGLIGVFGLIAYIFPIVLFVSVAFLISNRGKKGVVPRLIVVAVIIFLLCTFLSLVDSKGGFLGNIIVSGLVPAIGTIGSYVVVIVGLIICIIILTGKSLLKGVKSGSDFAYEKAKEDIDARRETSRIRRETTALKRADKKARGVSFATTLTEEKTKAPKLRELEAKEATVPEVEVAKEEVSEPSFVINRAEQTPPKSKPAKNENVAEKVEINSTPVTNENYAMPPLDLLKRGTGDTGISDADLRETATKLEEILNNFGVNVRVTNVSCGPSVTRYELHPEMGVKVSRIVALADDIKLNLAAPDIRIEAPIPGKAAVGIEVPNKSNATVMLRDLLESEAFKETKSKIAFAAGKDIAGKIIVADIAKMPHVLIAGATGSGKSVCINTLIMSILYSAHPDDVKFLMIDPKVVELSVYNGIPHLLIPVVTDPKKAAGALNWAVAEMNRRYQLFAEYKVRDMASYNKMTTTLKGEEGDPVKMPQIVVIVDELADLMMVAPGDVEEAICRLAQLARAAGIHLVLATQRPSVNVITGLIKANMPSRIAFSVTSGVDSRTIIDMNGAEKLLGKGDMLFYPTGYQKPVRVQGAFVSDKEVQKVVDFLKQHNEVLDYDEEIVEQVNTQTTNSTTSITGGEDGDGRDAYFTEAGRLIIEKEKASIGMLQRSFKIGFNRAARIMDQLHEAGVVGGEEGTKPRKILMTMQEFEGME